MDIQNFKAGMGISALVLASMATLGLEPVNSFQIIISTSSLLILSWLLATRKPLIDYRVVTQDSHAGKQPIPSASLSIWHRAAQTKHHDEELNALLDIAVSHVLRNTDKIKETCKEGKKSLFEMQRAVNLLQLNIFKQPASSQCDHFIDERLNYLDYHADKMILLIDKFSNISLKLQEIANHTKTSSPCEQIESVKLAQLEAARLARLLNEQLSELSGFNKNHHQDTASQVLARSGVYLQAIQQTLKADSNALLNILKVSACISSGPVKPESNRLQKNVDKPCLGA